MATADTQQSPHAGHHIVLPGQTPEGQHVLSVLLKRSYRFRHRQRCVRLEHDRRLVAGDTPFDGPMNSSMRFESDFVPFKLATDVVLNGRAYAPGGRAVELIASLMVGERRNDIAVIGDRQCRFRAGAAPVFSEPQPFETMDLRYERAYGGIDIYSDRTMPIGYPRNHVGKGFAVANIKEAVDGLPLPNLEPVSERLTPDQVCIGHFMHWAQQPTPQGFGWYPKHWQPRSSLAGVMPADRELEQTLRAAYRQVVPPHQLALYDQTQLPAMDFRFFNGASPGCVMPFLRGDETVYTRHLAAEAQLDFQLPGEHPRIALDIGKGVREAAVVLHTVMIHMDEREVDLVWRAAFPYPGPDWLPQLQKMEVLVQ